MITKSKHNRRSFVSAMAGMALVPVLGRAADIAAAPAESRPHREPDAFSLGIAGYSMRDFSVDETLWWLNRWQLRYWAIKDVHLPVNSGPEVIGALQAKCKTADVTIYGAGVLYMKSETDVTNAFAYAQRLGANIIIGVPNPELLTFVEKAVQASNIRLAIHNHGPDMDLYPTPKSVYDQIKNLDPKIGICMDIGHTQRCGVDPSDALGEFASRIYDIHIKDVDKAAKDGKTVPLGRGVIDIHRLVRTMRQVKYAGVCGLEYEGTKAESLPGTAESLGYLRGVLSST